MPENPALNQLTDSLSAPLGDLIAAVGRGVAEAQRAIDEATIEGTRALYSSDDQMLAELRRVGYQPTWYQIPEVEAELTISLSVSGQSAETGLGQASPAAGRVRLYAAPVDATYRNRFDFDLKAASRLKFRIVPVPPSPQASDLKAVPSLADKTLAEARLLLASLGIDHRHEGEEAVGDTAPLAGYSPAAGELLTPGQTVVLHT
jgi:hypothetical protein